MLNRITLNNTIWIAFGRITYAITQWLIIIFLTRHNNGSLLGPFTYALALISPIIILLQLNMRTFIVTDAKNKYLNSDYYTARIYSLIPLFLISLLFIIVKTDNLLLVYCIALITVYKSIESVSDIICGFLQKKGAMHYISKSNIFRGATSLLATVSVLSTSDSIFYALVLTSILWLFILIFYDIKNCKSMGISFHLKKRLNIKLCKETLPLGVAAYLASLTINIPLYFLESTAGLETVGVFASIYYFMFLGRLIVGSIIQAIAPNTSKLALEQSKLYSLFFMLVSIAITIGVIGILLTYFFGELILVSMYGSNFENYYELLLLIMFASGIGYINQFISLLLTSLRTLKGILVVHCLQVITITITSMFLIPKLGIIGAGYSILLSNCILIAMNCIVFFHRVKQSRT